MAWAQWSNLLIISVYLADSWKPLEEYACAIRSLDGLIAQVKAGRKGLEVVVGGDLQVELPGPIPGCTVEVVRHGEADGERCGLLLDLMRRRGFKAANTFVTTEGEEVRTRRGY